jgi:hypothetical protein
MAMGETVYPAHAVGVSVCCCIALSGFRELSGGRKTKHRREGFDDLALAFQVVRRSRS